MRISDDHIDWRPLRIDRKPAAGSFNTIYVSSSDEHSILDEQGRILYRGRLALKVPNQTNNPLDKAMNRPDRAVRIFHEINPQIAALEHRCLGPEGTQVHGWALPYYANSAKASDEQCAKEVLRVYTQTARIGFDFASSGNVLKVTEPGGTYALCIDVDVALLLKPDSTAQHQRRGSDASCNYYAAMEKEEELSYLLTVEEARPITANFIRTLLCLDRAGPTDDQRQDLTYEVMQRLSAVYTEHTDFYDRDPAVLLNLACHLKEKIALENCINQSPSPLVEEARAVLTAVHKVTPDNLGDLPKLTEILKGTRVVLENPTPDACGEYNTLAQNAQLSKKWGRLVGGAMLIFAGALLCTFGSLLICGGVGLSPFTFGVSGGTGIMAGSAVILSGLATIRYGYKTLRSGQEASKPQKAMYKFFRAADNIATTPAPALPSPDPHPLTTVQL